jgi:streptogramin lyase
MLLFMVMSNIPIYLVFQYYYIIILKFINLSCFSISAGKFWAWGSDGVSIIDPLTSQVAKNISCPTSKWGDATFIRDETQLKHLVFANDYSNSLVYVYDSVLEKVQNKIQLPSGSNPLHLYAVYYYDQVWVHNDGVGEFDVFRTSQVRYRSVAGVKASTTNVCLFDRSHLCR